MKIDYIKTVGFRKFKGEFETNLYDITNITGKNRSGKSNILFAIINILLGTNLSGDDKPCLINEKCDTSYGEMHFTDNLGVKHILIRSKNRVKTQDNFLVLDGKPINQSELISFYKDKKLFLSIINPLYFLEKKTAEQKELLDTYLSDIKPIEVFNTLPKEEQEILLKRHFRIPLREIYNRFTRDELQEFYIKYDLQDVTKKSFEVLSSQELFSSFKDIILRDLKYYYMLSTDEQANFINTHMANIFMDIAYDKLEKNEQIILEEIPGNIPEFLAELNRNIKNSETQIASLNGKIEYAQNIVNQELPTPKIFEGDMELSFAYQELNSLTSNKEIVDKEVQKKKIEDVEKEILNIITEIEELERNMKSGKSKFIAIKNGSDSICPTCEQHIQNISRAKTIQNMKRDLTNAFNRRNTLETKKKDLEYKLTVEKAHYYSLGGDTSIDYRKQISNLQDTITRLERQQKEIEQFNNEISIKEKNIQCAKTDITNFNKQVDIQNKYINQLKEARKVSQKLYIAYIEEKMKLAKQYLKDVKIKFTSVFKKTGEIKDDFIITYRNTPLSNLSKSETVATALEFANMFNKIAKTNFPVFIDDMESCADYDFIKEYAGNSQLIISRVVKGSNLKIADYNNSNNYTVIKPVVNGFKTIHTNTKATNIPKVA